MQHPALSNTASLERVDSPTDLEAAVRDALEPLAGLAVALLFGSRARGTGRPNSDLDVAIVPAPNLDGPRWRLQGRVAARLASLVPTGKVDVVLLDEAPDLLRQRIMQHGRMLILRDPALWRALRVQTMREYGDREPYRRLLARALKHRLLQETTPHHGGS